MLCSCRDLRSSNSSKSNYKIMLHLHTSVIYLCGCMFMHMHAWTDFVYTSCQCNFSSNNFYICALILFSYNTIQEENKIHICIQVNAISVKIAVPMRNYYTFTFLLFYYKLWNGQNKHISFRLHCLVTHQGHYHHTHLKRLTFNDSCTNSIWYVNTCSIC